MARWGKARRGMARQGRQGLAWHGSARYGEARKHQMAWIEAHQSLARHPKTLEAAEELHVSRHQLIGHLMELWWWALDARPRGGPLTARDVRSGASWGAESDITGVLVQVGFLDEQEGSYWLHDWDEYAGRLVQRREQNRARMKAARTSHVQRTNDARAEHVQRTDHTRAPHVHMLQNPTQPNPTEQNPTETEHLSARSDLTAEQQELVTHLETEVHRLVYGGTGYPFPGFCEDLIRKGATKSDVDFAVQASLGKGESYVRSVLTRRVNERSVGRDPDAATQSRGRPPNAMQATPAQRDRFKAIVVTGVDADGKPIREVAPP